MQRGGESTCTLPRSKARAGENRPRRGGQDGSEGEEGQVDKGVVVYCELLSEGNNMEAFFSLGAAQPGPRPGAPGTVTFSPWQVGQEVMFFKHSMSRWKDVRMSAS